MGAKLSRNKTGILIGGSVIIILGIVTYRIYLTTKSTDKLYSFNDELSKNLSLLDPVIQMNSQ